MARRTAADPLRIVESSYVWDPDEHSWLTGIVTSADQFHVGGGVIGYTVTVGDRVDLGSFVVSEHASTADAARLARAIAGFSPAVAQRAFAPTEFVGNATSRLERIARELGLDHTPAGVDDRIPQMWAVVGGNPHERAVVLCFPRHGAASHAPFPHRARRSLGLVGAHLGAALRLRALLPHTEPPTDAVLGTDGKLLDVDAGAVDARARDSLVHAVITSERARSRMRHAQPDEALQLWAALVRGRWTIVDSTERDGKRVILARRNQLRTSGLVELDDDERAVTWLAAFGHSYKYIAYELGVPIATVAGRLRRAMAKLGVVSRADLLTKLGVRA
jgi:DNA-binding CsgD family transcriptional regulator